MILKPPLGSQINHGHPLTRGLRAFWLMNEGGGKTIFDLSGTGDIGTLLGPTWMGGGLDFDGTNDNILLGLHSKFLGVSTTQPFTVIVQARADVYPAERDGFISCLDDQTGTVGWDLRLENEAVPSAGIAFRVGANAAVFAKADFVATNRNQYAGRFDGNNIEVFVNGIIGGITDTGTINGTDRNIYIGANFFPNTPGDANAGRWFDGRISYVLLYNRALSQLEIQQLYREPFAMFLFQPIDLWVAATSVGVAPPAGLAGIYYRTLMQGVA